MPKQKLPPTGDDLASLSDADLVARVEKVRERALGDCASLGDERDSTPADEAETGRDYSDTDAVLREVIRRLDRKPERAVALIANEIPKLYPFDEFLARCRHGHRFRSWPEGSVCPVCNGTRATDDAGPGRD